MSGAEGSPGAGAAAHPPQPGERRPRFPQHRVTGESG